MEIAPQLLFAQVMHKRLFPKINSFSYGVYYLCLPLSKISKEIENKYFKLNRWGILSFYSRDHGYRNTESMEKWVRDILNQNDLSDINGEIILITMPRVFGYVFNPVSFWYCYDSLHKLRAVICEVNNTFGETHSYICAHADHQEILKDDILIGKKAFHVSPFLQRSGHYEFRFTFLPDKMGAWINFYDKKGEKKLLTSVSGNFKELDQNTCRYAFWRYPAVTIKTIALIHWQAVKLFVKKAEYVPKPLQFKEKITRTQLNREKDR